MIFITPWRERGISVDAYAEIPYRRAWRTGVNSNWDEAKARANLAKHGVPFDYASHMFLDAGMVEFDASREGDAEVGRADRRQAVCGRFHRSRRRLPHHFRAPREHEGA